MKVIQEHTVKNAHTYLSVIYDRCANGFVNQLEALTETISDNTKKSGKRKIGLDEFYKLPNIEKYHLLELKLITLKEKEMVRNNNIKWIGGKPTIEMGKKLLEHIYKEKNQQRRERAEKKSEKPLSKRAEKTIELLAKKHVEETKTPVISNVQEKKDSNMKIIMGRLDEMSLKQIELNDKLDDTINKQNDIVGLLSDLLTTYVQTEEKRSTGVTNLSRFMSDVIKIQLGHKADLKIIGENLAPVVKYMKNLEKNDKLALLEELKLDLIGKNGK
jgi:hypothetical protein